MNALSPIDTPIPMPDLISEYNRITGRTEPADISVERWQEFRELLPATSGAAR
jgi:hypothetical protein